MGRGEGSESGFVMARWIHHGLVVVFAFVCVWWIFYEPYSPDRLLRPIPAGSTWVGRHDNLGERWPDMLRNPVVESTLLGFGMDEQELRTLPENKSLKRWMNLLGGRRIVGAYVPSMGPEAEPAWVMTSWVGGGGYGVRAITAFIPVKGLSKLYRHHGRLVWTYDLGGDAQDPILQVVITEGILIACYSRDKGAMKDLLDHYDGYLRGISRIEVGPVMRLAEWADGYADCGYAYLPYTSTLLYRIDRFDDQRVCGDLMSRGLPTSSKGLDAESGNSELKRLLGNIPLGMLALPMDLVADICMNRTSSQFPQIIGTMLANVHADMATLALLGGDYRGTLQKVRVPTFLVAARIPDRDQANMLAQGLVNQANGFKKLGLVPESVESAYPLFALGSTSKQPYMQFPRQDQVGYAMIGDLLVICSNFGVLDSLVKRYDTRVATFESEQGEWLREFKERHHQGFFWMNATRSGKAVKETLTAWSLTLLLNADTKERQRVAAIDDAKIWVDRLMHLETIRAWHRLEDERNQVRFELGPR